MKKIRRTRKPRWHLLTDGYSFPSARILRDAIRDVGGINLFVTKDIGRLMFPPVVRFGNSDGNWNDTALNTREIISLCSSKLRFSSLLRENNIFCPEFKILSRDNLPTSYPVLVRENLSWSGGRGIHLVENEQGIQIFLGCRYFFTEFVQMQTEFRVHIVGNTILKVFRKQREEGREEEKYPIRNLHRGYHFSLISKNLPKLVETVTKINEIMPTKNYFFALDVGWVPERKEYFVIEANSAPGLNQSTALLYAEYIVKNIKEKENE